MALSHLRAICRKHPPQKKHPISDRHSSKKTDGIEALRSLKIVNFLRLVQKFSQHFEEIAKNGQKDFEEIAKNNEKKFEEVAFPTIFALSESIFMEPERLFKRKIILKQVL